MRYALRVSGGQHADLQRHLFPGDGLEAAALVLCGRMNGSERHVFCARRVVLIPHERCKRTPISVDWPTDLADDLIREAMQKKMALVKIHSHPGGYEAFSERDNEADKSFFGSVCTLLEDDLPHASAVMLPGEGRIFARAVMADGTPQPIELVAVACDGIQLWHAEGDG